MNPKKLLVLVIILGGLVGFFFFDKARLEGIDEAKQRAREVVHMERDQVERVKVARLGEPPVVIARSAVEGAETRWKITEPVATAADQSTVENLVVTLVGARKESGTPVSESGEGATDYGLEPVEVRVTLETATGEESLDVGLLTPSESQVYARRVGEPEIFLLPRSLHGAVNKSLFDLRDKALVNVVNYRVDRIVVRDSSHEMDLRKESEDLWKIAGTETAMRAERGRITDFINDLNNAKAVQFIDDATEDFSPYGLVEAATTVQVWEGDQLRTLRFGDFQDSAQTRLYAHVEGRPGILVLENTALINAPVDVDRLRSKKFFVVKSWNADAITVACSSPTLALDFAKDASGEWQLTAADGEAEATGEERALDYSSFAKFYDTLDRLEAAGFSEASTKALELLAAPEWTLSVTAERDQLIERIEISALDPLTESRYARRVESGEIMVVYDEDLDELRRECEALLAPPAPAFTAPDAPEVGDAPDEAPPPYTSESVEMTFPPPSEP